MTFTWVKFHMIFGKLGISFAQGYGVVSSTKILESSHLKKRSFKSVLNSNGPKIEPWEIP